MLLRVISLMRFWRRVNFARIMPDVCQPVPGMRLIVAGKLAFALREWIQVFYQST
jgi:hypothetical protein